MSVGVYMWAGLLVMLFALQIWWHIRKSRINIFLNIRISSDFFSAKSPLLLLGNWYLINSQLKSLTFRSQYLMLVPLWLICWSGPILYYFPSPFYFADSICRNADTLWGEQPEGWDEVHCSGALHARPRRMERVELRKKHSDPQRWVDDCCSANCF